MVTEHFKILGRVARRNRCVRLVEGIGEAGAFDRRLRDAVHHLGCGNAGGFEDGRHHVDHMRELRADAALVGDVAGPRHRHALAHAAQMRGDLLEPAERRVEGP